MFDFGHLAKDYDQWYLTPEGQLHDRIQKRDVLSFLPPLQRKGSLLDVGCGTGHWSKFFDSLGYTVAGIDISEKMIERAKNKCESQCFFQVGDANRLPFKDRCFDVVTAMATLEFVSDRTNILAEMFRCVKKDGRVLIGTLNRLASINRQRIAKGKEPYASGRLFSPKELHALLKRFGSVHLVASPFKEKEMNMWMWKWIKHWLIPTRLRPLGPFIVAEVRQ